MSKYALHIKNQLLSIIESIAAEPEKFVLRPGKDFTRNRKLPFEEVMKMLLSMEGGCLDSELLNHFGFTLSTASASAFVQQRTKILPAAFRHLFYEFVSGLKSLKTFEGYRLLAFDGSDIHLPLNPNDAKTYYETKGKKGYNLLHLNALYDLHNKIYLDASLQPGKKQHERKALTQMMDRSPLKEDVLLICDRGLESYNVLAHIEEKAWKYLIRVKDVDSTGIWSKLKLPETNQFDVNVDLILTRKLNNEIRAHQDEFRNLHTGTPFDYLTESDFYLMSFRAVRVEIEEGTYHCFITNLSADQFSADDVKEFYHMRWGIETSFRELKHALGLVSFHSKKTECVTQEVFAKLVMYNFCSTITLNVVIKQPKGKFPYQVNYTRAIQICRKFFMSFAHPPDIEALIRKYILPVRPSRSYPRKVKSRTFVSFLYRVA